ncbi:hypothetical protein ESB00_04390 [Oleiharenicola lentus]|uniref:Uncharacterized protein n=1 Tax=Oleiharenicola lentus TaxID=2508720 RepID=A0A4Q1C883_9BACT|nr:hypothetical protein [Oleiharenicola lentus]RXK55143.1 hypothetical protein ESB00_04390 [Oleiharenicola lentus]
MRFILILLLLANTSVFAQSNPMTAEELFVGCELAIKKASGEKIGEIDSIKAMRAIAYVDGYFDSIAMVQNLNPQISIVDFSEQPTNAVILSRIVEAIRSNPRVRAEGTARIVVMHVARSITTK